ncbi:hypothetical protein DFJ73DRAFT_817008 [Zopfochytrium polystomum]|nr:hypothetical protein DFJ73DRAFT_817008 [Zopfochytrium polystomum]
MWLLTFPGLPYHFVVVYFVGPIHPANYYSELFFFFPGANLAYDHSPSILLPAFALSLLPFCRYHFAVSLFRFALFLFHSRLSLFSYRFCVWLRFDLGSGC